LKNLEQVCVDLLTDSRIHGSLGFCEHAARKLLMVRELAKPHSFTPQNAAFPVLPARTLGNGCRAYQALQYQLCANWRYIMQKLSRKG
jgi:hypothetical protein